VGSEFGKRVRYLREQCQLSQEALAGLAGISRRWLAEIESGKEPRLPLAVSLANELARHVPGVHPADLLMGISCGARPRDGASGDASVNRRQFNRSAALGLAMIGGGVLYVPEFCDTVLDLERLTGDHVDAHVLVDLAALTHAYGRQTFAMKPESLLPTVHYHFSRLNRLLGVAPPSSRRRLKALCAETAILIGQLSWRAGDDAGAQSYYATGEALAVEAGEAPLRAFMLGLRGVLYSGVWQDDRAASPKTALALMNEAISIAGRGSSTHLREFLYCIRAEEAAASGNARQAERDLNHADAAARQAPGDAESGFLTHWDANRLLGYRAHCALLLAEPDAVTTIETALVATDPTLTGARSATLADLAAAYANGNEFERSCSILIESLDIAADGGSEAHLKRIAKVRRSYPNGIPAVQRLDDRLRMAPTSAR
jgi:transcriptional regulator with XRE-family HTH domain